MSISEESRRARHGLFWGFLGVLSFAGSFPSAKLAVMELDPFFVGLGRALVAAVLAAILLLVTRQPLPKGEGVWRDIGLAIIGVVVGFPVLSNLSLMHIPVAHVSVVNGLLPLMTAVFAALLTGERHQPAFWGWAVAGGVLVVGFAVLRSASAVQQGGDWLGYLYIFAAIVVCAIGYVAGARLSKRVGSWQSICWSLVFSVPLLLWPVWVYRPQHSVSWLAWSGFTYQALVSMFLGFFAWYRGLALGGIARVGQIQLLQPFLSLMFVALVLHESIIWWMWLVALGVVGCVAMGRRSG